MINTSSMGAYIIASFLSTAEPLEVPINDYFCMIEAMHYEANGEGYKGKQLVGNIVQHRMDRVKKWDSYCTTIKYGGQFSYNKGLKVDLSKYPDLVSFKETVKVAYLAVQGELPDISNGADHYYNPDKVSKIPSWHNDDYVTGKVGNHLALRLIDDNGRWYQ